jgi:hypothetical protein
MDFFERFLGVSPDGGDGSLEALYLLAGAVVVAAAVFRRRLRSRRANTTTEQAS